MAKSDATPSAIHFTAPPQFGGLEGRWSPEDLLLSAIAACFTTTFRALADYSKFHYSDLEVEVKGTVRKVESGYQFAEIVICPAVTVLSAEDGAKADRLLEKANRLCLVSRALVLPQKFEPQVHTEVAAQTVEFK